jgi:hypothetical protein
LSKKKPTENPERLAFQNTFSTQRKLVSMIPAITASVGWEPAGI